MPVKRKVVRKKVYRKRAVVSRKKAYKKTATRTRRTTSSVVYERQTPVFSPPVPIPVFPKIEPMTTKLVAAPTGDMPSTQKIPPHKLASPPILIPAMQTGQAKQIYTAPPTVVVMPPKLLPPPPMFTSMTTKLVAAPIPMPMKSAIVKKKLPKAALPAKRIPIMKTSQAKMIYTPAPGTFSLAFTPAPVKSAVPFTVMPTIKPKPVIQVIPVAKKTVPVVTELPISMSFEEYQKNVKNTQDIMLMVHQKLNTVYSKNLWGGRDVYNAAIGYYKGGAFGEINTMAHKAITGGTAVQRVVKNNVLHYKYGVTFNWANNEAIVKALNSTDLENGYALIGAKYFQWEGNLLRFHSFNVLFLNDLILMAPSPFAAPTTLFRGVALSKKPELKKLYQQGAIVEQTMFWSTSSAISVANGFLGKSKCCLLQIHLPAGYPALFIDDYGQSEQEFLLAPFTKTGEIARFAVTSVEKGKEFLVYAESSFPDAYCIGTSKSKEEVAPCLAKSKNAKLERKSFKVINLSPVAPTFMVLSAAPVIAKTVSVPIVAAPVSIPAKAPMVVPTIATPITMRSEQYNALIQARKNAMREMHEKLKTVFIGGSTRDIYFYTAVQYKMSEYNVINQHTRTAIVDGTPAQHAVITSNVLHYKHGVTFNWASHKDFGTWLYTGEMEKIQAFIGAEYFEWAGNPIGNRNTLFIPILNDLVLTLPSPFTAPTTVFRGLRLSGNPDLKKLYKVGQTVIQSQFWSTTASISTANVFLRDSKCCILQIELPAGYPALFLEGLGKPEQEFLLAPFTKTGDVVRFRVTGIEKGKEFSVYPGAPDAYCVDESDVKQCMIAQQAKIESKFFKVIHLSPVQYYVPPTALPVIAKTVVQPLIPAKAPMIVPTIAAQPPVSKTPISMTPEEFKALYRVRYDAMKSMREKLKTVNVPGQGNADIYQDAARYYKDMTYQTVNRYTRAAIAEGTPAQHAVTNNVLHYKYGVTFGWASNQQFVTDWNANAIPKIQAFIGAKYFEWEGNPIDKYTCYIPILNDLVLTLPSPFGAPTTVFRGVRLSGIPDIKKLYKVGQRVVQSQFWSTSASISVANFFLKDAKCCLLQIDLPAGYPAMFMEGIGMFLEQEFLLAPFTKTGAVAQFTVTSVEKQKKFLVYPDMPDAGCVIESDYQLCMKQAGARIEQKSFKVIHLRPIL